MRVLVTGGAGYIGSAVCWKLTEREHKVVVIDNLKYGAKDSLPPGTTLIRRDLTDRNDQHAILFALESNKIEAVCHLAAESEIPVCQNDPLLAYRVNVTGGLMLLKSMYRAGVHRLVYSSTAAVYAHDNQMPLTEDSKLSAESPYGASKLAFEQSLRWMPGLQWVAFRYFNVCGATERVWERPIHRSRLISVAMDTARGVRPEMTLNGTDFDTSDGTPLRDYVHVDDIATAHCLALENPNIKGVFNLGIGTWYSNREVIATVERVTGKQVKVIEGPRRPGDPRALVANSDKAQLELGWRPQYKSLEAMVESCWRHEP